MSNNLSRLIQNKGENLAIQHKMFFKSHDLSSYIQILLLALPILFSLYSLVYWWDRGMKNLDFFSMAISIMALIYFMNYWKNQELYMEWGEKYLILYKEIETYFKKWDLSEVWIQDFDLRLNELNCLKKPAFHIWSKLWTDLVVEKETTYSNESHPWWKSSQSS